jgi:ABC-type phosphate transport system substrate-binding protein
MTTRWLLTTTTALALAATALAGCGTDDAATPATASTQPTTAAPTTAGSTPATTADGQTSGAPAGEGGSARFVAVVRDKLPGVAADRRDEEIGLIAEEACAGLSGGKSADEVVAQARTLGTVDAEATDHATARELIKLAIDTVCPGQAKRVDDF